MGGEKIIVFLEADHNRAAVQYQRINKVDRARTFWVRTAKETIDILKDYRESLDIVSLEHDLSGGPINLSASENCGMEVVRWLEKQNSEQYFHVRFIVHTWNIKAGKKMAFRLWKQGYRVIRVPFGL